MILVLAAIKKIHMDAFSLSQDGDQQVSFCCGVCLERKNFSQQIQINFVFQDKTKVYVLFRQIVTIQHCDWSNQCFCCFTLTIYSRKHPGDSKFTVLHSLSSTCNNSNNLHHHNKLAASWRLYCCNTFRVTIDLYFCGFVYCWVIRGH